MVYVLLVDWLLDWTVPPCSYLHKNHTIAFKYLNLSHCCLGWRHANIWISVSALQLSQDRIVVLCNGRKQDRWSIFYLLSLPSVLSIHTKFPPIIVKDVFSNRWSLFGFWREYNIVTCIAPSTHPRRCCLARGRGTGRGCAQCPSCRQMRSYSPCFRVQVSGVSVVFPPSKSGWL